MVDGEEKKEEVVDELNQPKIEVKIVVENGKVGMPKFTPNGVLTIQQALQILEFSKQSILNKRV